MKFNPVVVRAIMHTQFFELKKVNGTKEQTPEQHFPFAPEDVDEVHFGKQGADKRIWFRLKDGRTFDVRGQPAGAGPDGDAGQGAPLNAALLQLVDDGDAIDRLSLSMIPLSSAHLRQARLVKNSRLETMVELHASTASGSLQLRPEDLAAAFPGQASDLQIVSSLAPLHSYDVYSLRMSLRKLGISVENATLDLSEGMKSQLDSYTAEFTLPLVRAVFGAGGGDIVDRQSLMTVFRDPDRARAAERLRLMSAKTGIALEDLPRFLETYADAFLSVAYYQHRFETIHPDINRCALWLRDLRRSNAAQISAQAMALCKKVEEALRFLTNAIQERLRLFRGAFDMFWGKMNKAGFEQMQDQLQGRYVGTGAMLCGLVVKMRHWSQNFQHPRAGGPSTRVQYLTAEMAPGLEQLCQLQI